MLIEEFEGKMFTPEQLERAEFYAVAYSFNAKRRTVTLKASTDKGYQALEKRIKAQIDAELREGEENG